MTLPSSGTISLADIQGEFGGPTPIVLSNYYRGGSYVPDTAPNAGIPTSGALTIPTHFYGGTAYITPVINTSAVLSLTRSATLSTVYAGYRLNNNGTSTGNSASGSSSMSVSLDNWLLSGSPSDVWVATSGLSGSFTWNDDSAGVRVNMATSRSFGNLDASADFTPSYCSVDLKFYDAASGGTLLGTISSVTTSANRE